MVVASQLIDHPPAGVGQDLEAGAWLGLAGAGLLLLGAFMSRTGISLAVDPARSAAQGPAASPQAGAGAPPGDRETSGPPASSTTARGLEQTAPLPPEERRL